MIGLGAAAVGMSLAVIVAYVAVRTRYRLRAILDFLTWLPAGIPGNILGLGFLWMFLSIDRQGILRCGICFLVVFTLFAEDKRWSDI